MANATRHDENDIKMNKREVVARLLKYLKGHILEIVLTLLAMGGAVTISLINPLIMEKAVDEYIPNKDVNGLIKLAAFAVVLNIVFMLLNKARTYLMALLSNKIVRDIRNELYRHIQTLAFTFFDSRPTGKILARITGDVNSLQQVFSSAVTTFIPGIATITGVLFIMMSKNVVLGLLCMSTVPVMILALLAIEKYSTKMWALFRKKSSNMNAYVHEDISGMSIVQSFAAEDETSATFDELVNEHQETFRKAVRVNDFFGPSCDLCWAVSVVLLYWFGVKLLNKDMVSIGVLIAFGTYVGMFWEPVMNIASFYRNMITNLSAAERIFEVLDTPADVKDKSDAIELPPIEGNVEFKNVYFTYDIGTPDETRVLTDVSFKVNKGERIALVGPTGAGKTTIINLLSRFYDIQEGQVLVDGYDVRDVTIKSLRQQMGVMTQENFIFEGTVADNIRYGKRNATQEEIEEAAKAVNAHDFIMKMEKGYDTMLMERGAGLSIGQRQLIAFARTMVSKPKILILDEATSSIDTKTELMVQKGIDGLLKGRTSFVIAHRLSTIQNADRIFVVDNEGIVESGTPSELIRKKDGAYRKLYMAQFEEIKPKAV